MKEKGGWNNCCGWLGYQFYKSINERSFTVNTVVQGLMAHQRIWTEAYIAEWKQKQTQAGPGKDLSPEKLKELTESYMKKYVQQSMTAWEDFPELKTITDQDINDILEYKVTSSS